MAPLSRGLADRRPRPPTTPSTSRSPATWTTRNHDNPAIADFHPGVSSDVLYVTNGETTDYAHVERGALAWTPELSEGCDGCGFVFPDDEATVQEEFVRTLTFASTSRSRQRTRMTRSRTWVSRRSRSTSGATTPTRPVKPLVNFNFDVSYGDPQEVRVLAKRALGDVTLKYSVNGGPRQSAPTEEWNGGERYGGQTDVYYHIMSGTVTGTSPGDSVKVWFEGGGRRRVTRSRTRPRSSRTTTCSSWRPRTTPAHRRCRPRAALPLVLRGCASGEWDRLRRLRRRRPEPQGGDGPRRAVALRRRRLVHGRRHHPP